MKFPENWTCLDQFSREAGNSLRASMCGSSNQQSVSTTPCSASYTNVKTWLQRSQSQKCFTPCTLPVDPVTLRLASIALSGRKRKNLPPSSQ